MTPETARKALRALTFAWDFVDDEKLAARVPDYVAAMLPLTDEQWQAAERSLRNRPDNAMPSGHEFAQHCQRAAQAGSSRQRASWVVGDLHANPALARYAVRDWLVNRYEWPGPMAPEPSDEDWPWRADAETEFERAVDRMAGGNRPDGTGSGAIIARARLLELGEALGRGATAQEAIRRCDVALAPGERGTLEQLAQRMQRRHGSVPAVLASAIASFAQEAR